MSLYYPNVDANYVFTRNSDEYINLIQTKTIKFNRVTLKEIPSHTADFTVEKSDGTFMTKVASSPSNINEYTVDYTTGRVTFHADMENQEVEISYTGIGQVNFGANRVILDTSSTNVEEITVQDVIDAQTKILDVKELVEQNQVVKNTVYQTDMSNVSNQISSKVDNNDFNVFKDDTTAQLATTSQRLNTKAYKAFVTPEDFGAIGNGIVDDTIPLLTALEYCKVNKTTLRSYYGKVYLISQSITFDGDYDVELCGAEIKTNTVMETLIFIDGSEQKRYGTIKGLRVNCANVNNGVYCTYIRKRDVSDCYFFNFEKNGLYIKEGSSAHFNNLHFYGAARGCVGIHVATSDLHFTDLFMIDCHTALKIYGFNYFTRVHAWMWRRNNGTVNFIENSIFADIYTSNSVFFNECYPDTYHYCFQTHSDYTPRLFLDKINVYYNTLIFTSDVINSFSYKETVVINNPSRTDPYGMNIHISNSYIQGLVLNETKYTRFANSIVNLIQVKNTITRKLKFKVSDGINLANNNVESGVLRLLSGDGFTLYFDFTLKNELTSTVTVGEIPFELYYAVRSIAAYGEFSNSNNNCVLSIDSVGNISVASDNPVALGKRIYGHLNINSNLIIEPD